jgi:hypothetical protein
VPCVSQYNLHVCHLELKPSQQLAHGYSLREIFMGNFQHKRNDAWKKLSSQCFLFFAFDLIHKPLLRRTSREDTPGEALLTRGDAPGEALFYARVGGRINK